MEASRRRRIAIWALTLAGALAAVLAVFAVWTARQLLDGDEWAQTNQALIADPAVQDALATTIVDTLFDELAPAATLGEALPPRLRPLAAPAAAALREPAVDVVRRGLSGPRLQRLWAAAADLTHRQFLALVEERGRAVRLPGGGAVVVDLRPLLRDAAQRVGLPGTRVEAIPEDRARIVVLSADQLDAMQRAVRLLKALALVLVLLAIGLLAAAVALARARREALVTAMLALIGAMVVVLLARRLLGDTVIADVAATPTGADAAEAVWRIGTSLLAQIARTVLLLAGILLLAAVLAGPGRAARRVRAAARPLLLTRPDVVHGTVLVVLLAALAAGVVPGIRTVAAAVLLVAVAVGGVELVRRAARADGAVA